MIKLIIMLLCSLMMSTMNAVIGAKKMSVAATVRLEKMPRKEDLKKRLDAAGFVHFSEKSAIIKSLAGYWLSESQARFRANRCFIKYIENYGETALYMNRNKPALLEVVLQKFRVES